MLPAGAGAAVPMLERHVLEGVAFHSDAMLLRDAGVVVGFSERGGGASDTPYATLNLATHVGDDPARVDANRDTLLTAVGLGEGRDRLVTADQVHGTRVTRVGNADAGAGAKASCGRAPVPLSDALFTTTAEVPLMLLYADCVPIILVALRPTLGVAVVHAGWRGALDDIVGKAAHELAKAAGCATSSLLAYVGPHIGPCCYETSPEIMSQFRSAFGTLSRAAGRRLDLGAAVRESLVRSGVPVSRQCHLGECTAHEVERFYSYRAEGVTGRHAALAAILGADR
jgi:YfiH family protein